MSTLMSKPLIVMPRRAGKTSLMQRMLRLAGITPRTMTRAQQAAFLSALHEKNRCFAGIVMEAGEPDPTTDPAALEGGKGEGDSAPTGALTDDEIDELARQEEEAEKAEKAEQAAAEGKTGKDEAQKSTENKLRQMLKDAGINPDTGKPYANRGKDEDTTDKGGKGKDRAPKEHGDEAQIRRELKSYAASLGFDEDYNSILTGLVDQVERDEDGDYKTSSIKALVNDLKSRKAKLFDGEAAVTTTRTREGAPAEGAGRGTTGAADYVGGARQLTGDQISKLTDEQFARAKAAGQLKSVLGY